MELKAILYKLNILEQCNGIQKSNEIFIPQLHIYFNEYEIKKFKTGRYEFAEKIKEFELRQNEIIYLKNYMAILDNIEKIKIKYHLV